MLYQLHEWQRASLTPARVAAANALAMLQIPGNPIMPTPLGRWAAAALDHFEHGTRHFGRPAFGHAVTVIGDDEVPVIEEVVLGRTWCELLHFRRLTHRPADPKVLMVAPMSGHFATLLRGTVEAFLPDHDVYVTNWTDAREVPALAQGFGFEDYVDMILGFLRFLGPETHVIAVCQPAVPVLAAVSLINAEELDASPASMTLIGGPIDTREAPTAVNTFAKKRDLDWFRRSVIHSVPFGYPGFLRQVYPGFLQLAGFMAMNLERHWDAHWQMFLNLVDGDGESLASKRAFYEEYRAVMDMPAEFFLETVRAVFHEHLLPRGLLTHRGLPVEPAAIERTAMLTIEGEKDDISGLGQTRAAHKLTTRLPQAKRLHIEQKDVGHYGLFNGRRFREQVAPAIKAFIVAHD